jgi:hypothetical protein
VVKAPAVATYTRLHDAAAATIDSPGSKDIRSTV